MAARLWVVSFIVQESSVCPAALQWKHGLLAAAEAVRAAPPSVLTPLQATAMSAGVEFAKEPRYPAASGGGDTS